MFSRVIVFCFIFLSALYPSHRTNAQALSTGCSFLNNGGAGRTSTPVTGSAAVISIAYNAGEQITVSLVGGTATTANVSIPSGTPVGSINQGGALVYPVAANVSLNILAQNATGGGTTIQIRFFCDIPSAASPSASGGQSVDNDRDGILNEADNCPDHANPGQENGWGGAAGDVCDTNWYNPGIGIKGYPLSNGIWQQWANCSGDACRIIAQFDPSVWQPDRMPRRYQDPDSGGWYVEIFYLGQSDEGYEVYQANTYNPTDTLIDERLQFFVGSEGWYWFDRLGDPQYNGTADF